MAHPQHSQTDLEAFFVEQRRRVVMMLAHRASRITRHRELLDRERLIVRGRIPGYGGVNRRPCEDS